jgi:competence protein ComFC
LKAKQMAENVKNAFGIHPKRAEVLRNKSVVLIDDVYTTGSTVKECAKALLKGGVKRVYVLSLARVVRPERF